MLTEDHLRRTGVVHTVQRHDCGFVWLIKGMYDRTTSELNWDFYVKKKKEWARAGFMRRHG